MEQKLKVVIPFKGTTFNSHNHHNPHYDILEGKLDDDTIITYCKCVKGKNKFQGTESMEYYSGRNYVMTSKKPSYSRHYDAAFIPKKYYKLWILLRSIYEDLPK